MGRQRTALWLFPREQSRLAMTRDQ
jgi:hypothetical protein